MTTVILIVDDSRAIRELIKMTLIGVAEIVGECSNGSEALAAYERLRPDCVVRSNAGTGIGSSGNLTVVNSVLSDNEGGEGGAIFNSGTAAITNSTILHNSAGTGGGIFNSFSASRVTITNSSIIGNIATGEAILTALGTVTIWGSAISNQNGRVTITNSTVAGNDDQGFARMKIVISGLLTTSALRESEPQFSC